MDKVIVTILAVAGVVALVVLFGFLFAFPVMWLVNWLFTPAALTFVFGTAKLNVWQAWGLLVLSGLLFKSTNTTSK